MAGNPPDYDSTQDGQLKRSSLPSITGQSSGRAVEIAQYDGQGRPTKINAIAADGSIRDSYRFYDELGRLTRAVGPMVSATDTSRPVTCTVYAPLGDIKEIWAGSTTDTSSATCTLDGVNIKKQLSAAYDDFGRKLSQTDQLGKVWKWTWNVHGELLTSQTPVQAAAGQTTTYAYGAKGGNGETQGQLKSRIVPGAQTASYTRNALGQVTKAETKDGSNQTVVAYDYSYDAAHRLATVTDSRANKSLTYTWTPGGRLARVVDSDGHSTSFAYDGVGRISSLTAPNGEHISFVWDAGGRLIEKRLNSGFRTTQSWFEDGSLKDKKNLFSTTTLSSHIYTLDSQGRRATHAETINGTAKNWTYGYDNLDRLTSASDGTAETTSYDIYGNRRTKSNAGGTTAYLYDLAHQLSEIRQTNDSGTLIGGAVHDADGHLTKLCEGSSATRTATDCTSSGTGATTLALAWNALDHLLTATRTGANAVAERYAYDDSGRRLKKTSAGVTTHYGYDGDDIHAEWATTLSGMPSAVYAHGVGADEPLLRLTGSTNSPAATQTAYLQDGLGSVVGTVNSAGTLISSQRFDAWGNKGSTTGTTPTYGFTGREPDATGLTYFRARYQHPGLGRFLSRDPAGMTDAVSPYAYVGNSPTNFVDPSGMFLDIALDVGFIAYDIAVLGHDLINNGGKNWAVHTGALAADVVGAVVPFVTGAGQAYRAGNKLVDVAKQADNLVPAGGSAATRGTKVHTEFDAALKNGAGGKNVSGEQPYVKGEWLQDKYRPKGSSNPDAVVGNPANPTAAFDLKTGKSGISNSQMAKYEKNLPEGTPVYTLTPNGHNVPRPQSMSGMGAGFNAGYLLGDSDTAPYLGGNSGGGLLNPRSSK